VIAPSPPTTNNVISITTATVTEQPQFTPQTFKNLLKFWEDVQTKSADKWPIEPSEIPEESHRTLYSLIDSYVSQQVENIQILSKIISDHWINGYIELPPSGALASDKEDQIVTAGLGFPLKTRQNQQIYRELEPAIFKALFNWFRDTNNSIAYYYAFDKRNLDSQTFGREFDRIVAISFLELYGKPFQEIPLFNNANISFLTPSHKFEATRLLYKNLPD
jgi:hypothetical protein